MHPPMTMTANFRSDMEVYRIDPQTTDEQTVYGYPVKEIILFANMCRRHGITEKDLLDFCRGAVNGWECGYDDFCRVQENMYEEAKKRFEKGGGK